MKKKPSTKNIIIISLLVVLIIIISIAIYLYSDMLFRDNENNDFIDSENSVNILFVGNSHVFWGKVPRQLYSITKNHDVEIVYKDISSNGAHLSRSKDEAISELQTGRFDYVVLQDNTRLLPEGIDEFLNIIRLLCNEAKANDTIPVLFNPAVNDTVRLSNYTEAYKRAAYENDAILVDAGGAWVYTYQTVPGISLYAWDGIHANNAGAFLTACVFAAVLFDIKVEEVLRDCRYRGNDAILLAQAAWGFIHH